jgi:hypothetical protein
VPLSIIALPPLNSSAGENNKKIKRQKRLNTSINDQENFSLKVRKLCNG